MKLRSHHADAQTVVVARVDLSSHLLKYPGYYRRFQEDQLKLKLHPFMQVPRIHRDFLRCGCLADPSHAWMMGESTASHKRSFARELLILEYSYQKLR